MIIQGVLDRSLDNFVCLRGFARLGKKGRFPLMVGRMIFDAST